VGRIVDANGNPATIDLEALRKWYLEEFKGAVFIGEVTEIHKVKVKWLGHRRPMKKVTVWVEGYWVGVKNPELTIHTGVGGGDCGVRYTKGERYFFFASSREGRLETDICSHHSLDDGVIEEWDKFLGERKAFPG
jgi:hypothetical protein